MIFAYENDFNDEEYSSEKSSEDGIDSDIEIALYSQIHYAKDFSSEIVQKNTSAEPEINLGSSPASSESRMVSQTVQGDIKNPIMIPSNTSSDSDEIKVISEVKHANTNAPEVISFASENNVDGKCKNRKSWLNEFVSINCSSSDEEENFEMHKRRNVTNTKFTLDSSSETEVFHFKQEFLSGNSTENNSTALMDYSSNSSEDIFKYPCNSKDEISINLASNSSEKQKKYDGKLWHVNDEDIYPDQRSRYYNKMDHIVCRNCSRRGHRVKDCDKSKKEVVCFLCGFSGHLARKCPTGSCERCSSSKHRTKKCKVSIETLQSVQNCKLCKYVGHKRINCPDFWRRYHLTTDDKSVMNGKTAVNDNTYCYNCGKEGHFGYQCYRSRLNSITFPTSPFIVRYNNPNNITTTKKKKKKKKKGTMQEFVKRQMMKKKRELKSIRNSTTQAKPENSAKHFRHVTDYVNLLHLPKGKSKKQKRRSAINAK